VSLLLAMVSLGTVGGAFTMSGSRVLVMAMLLEFLMQHLGFFERMLAAGTEDKNGSSREQQSDGELHEQIRIRLGKQKLGATRWLCN